MGIKFEIDSKAMKNVEKEAKRKLEAASKKHPIPADASLAEQKRAAAKIVKAASKMK